MDRPKIAADAAARRLVYERNQMLMVGNNDWNIDLILGPPPGNLEFPVTTDPIVKASPSTIRIAIEAKTIMTEHGNVDTTKTALVVGPPAPQTGDPLHYDSFLQRICDRYTQRWV